MEELIKELKKLQRDRKDLDIDKIVAELIKQSQVQTKKLKEEIHKKIKIYIYSETRYLDVETFSKRFQVEPYSQEFHDIVRHISKQIKYLAIHYFFKDDIVFTIRIQTANPYKAREIANSQFKKLEELINCKLEQRNKIFVRVSRDKRYTWEEWESHYLSNKSG